MSHDPNARGSWTEEEIREKRREELAWRGAELRRAVGGFLFSLIGVVGLLALLGLLVCFWMLVLGK